MTFNLGGASVFRQILSAPRGKTIHQISEYFEGAKMVRIFCINMPNLIGWDFAPDRKRKVFFSSLGRIANTGYIRCGLSSIAINGVATSVIGQSTRWWWTTSYIKFKSVYIGLAYWKWRRYLPSERKQRFMAKYVQSDNVLCQLFAHVESV